MLYVGTYRLPFVITVRKPSPGEASYDFIGELRYLPGPRGLPLLKPPFGSMVAIDMNTGEHRWRIPVGRSSAVPAIDQLGIREQLGLPLRSWALVTKTVLVVVQMGYYSAPRLLAGSNRPGRRHVQSRPASVGVRQGHRRDACRDPLPANATGSPISYVSGGKQYIVFPVGGGPVVEELIAVAL
jgi:quinoprotein glucose dehydrogenase